VGLIYLDSCLVIYAVERDPEYGAKVLAAIKNAGDVQFAISPLVKLECLVKPIAQANLLLQRYFESAMGNFLLLEMTEAVFVLATQLRARFGIKTPDSLHLACAAHHECAELWTNDERLAKAGSGFVRNVLRS
jgi:uncharacterized protein